MTSARNLQTVHSFASLIEYISNIVSTESGIILGDKQLVMVETRVKKRMLDLGIKHPEEYYSFIKTNFAEEKEELISLLTTHHTFFFREFQHFETVLKYLPKMVENAKKLGRTKIRVWSAACSRGHEVYSLAMFLDYHLKEIDPSMDYEVFGSDIDRQSIQIAQNRVYRKIELDKSPIQYIGNHWSKGTGAIRNYVKLKNYIFDKCQFETINLIKIQHHKMPKTQFDFVFVRNVLIYFDEEHIQKIINNIKPYISDKSLIICGTSECLPTENFCLSRIEPYVYSLKSSDKPIPIFTTDIKTQTHAVKRVVCVDDSPAVLKILELILNEENGYQIVGKAKNGIEAIQLIKQLKPDAVTLDLHMPEMDGLQYLEANMSPEHPPVLVVSSASREDSSTAMRALELGASDFVEKPQLTNLKKCGEEIRTKLKLCLNSKPNRPQISSVDKEFAHKLYVSRPESKAVICFASAMNLDKLAKIINEVKQTNIPVLIFFESQEHVLKILADRMQSKINSVVSVLDNDIEIKKGQVYVGDYPKNKRLIDSLTQKRSCLSAVIGLQSKDIQNYVFNNKLLPVIVEESPNTLNQLTDNALYILTVESIGYHIIEYFSKEG